MNLVETAVDALVSYNIISASMRRFYEYSIEIIIERLISLASMFLIAVCLRKVIPAILFLSFFLLLRRHTGGYHASSFTKCYVESILIFTIIMIYGDIITLSHIVVIVALSASITIIMIVGTINHPNMGFSNAELRESKKTARYVLILEILVVLSLYFLGASEQCIVFMSWGIILCAISIVVAKISKQEVEK